MTALASYGPYGSVYFDFVSMCMDKFDQLDADQSGVLEADELAPLIMDMVGGRGVGGRTGTGLQPRDAR